MFFNNSQPLKKLLLHVFIVDELLENSPLTNTEIFFFKKAFANGNFASALVHLNSRMSNSEKNSTETVHEYPDEETVESPS